MEDEFSSGKNFPRGRIFRGRIFLGDKFSCNRRQYTYFVSLKRSNSYGNRADRAINCSSEFRPSEGVRGRISQTYGKFVLTSAVRLALPFKCTMSPDIYNSTPGCILLQCCNPRPKLAINPLGLTATYTTVFAKINRFGGRTFCFRS
jgi:hypothetical protein